MDIVVPSPFGNDMVSCLAHSFSKSEVYLTQLSQCVTFVVRRQDDIALPGTEKEPLKFPASIYLDRFMQENSEQAAELWNLQEGMQQEIQKLITGRQKLSHWKVSGHSPRSFFAVVILADFMWRDKLERRHVESSPVISTLLRTLGRWKRSGTERRTRTVKAEVTTHHQANRGKHKRYLALVHLLSWNFILL